MKNSFLCSLALTIYLTNPLAFAGEETQIAATLDNLHRFASVADGQSYFSLFTEDAVFFGTDATERWSIGEFRDYAEPRFNRGQGWTYRARSRHIFVSADSAVAWFDEDLENANYGQCRGTGVLVKIDGHWKIIQYNLTIPIPNAIAGKVVEMIRNPPED